MPKGKSPRRSKLYGNANEMYAGVKGATVSDDMRPKTPRNLEARKKLHEAANKDDHSIYTDWKKNSKKGSLGDQYPELGKKIYPKKTQVTPGKWKTTNK